jgi:acetyl esterase/lipase
MGKAALATIAALLAGCSPVSLLNGTIDTNGIDITKNIAYAPNPRGKLDLYRPHTAKGPLPVIVFIYGGSWRTGDKSMYPFVAAAIARRGAVVIVPNYRLYPEVQFPAFLQDNARAVAWAAAHAGAYGGDTASIFLMGHSAGAYDVAMLALDPKWLAAEGVRRDALAGVVGIAGPYDFLPITDPDIRPVFAPVQDGPASQPVTYVDGHNPPMLLLAGAADETVQPRNTLSLAGDIATAGGPVEQKIYPGVGHIGIILAFAPLFSGKAPVVSDVWAFITAHSRPD